MKSVTLLLTLLALIIQAALCADERIAFAYEMIRHGARSPGGPDPGKFQVPPGMLTA
jgi:hypothetical protein